MAALEAAGGPRHKLLRDHCDWRALYTAFMASPHFHPWFAARRHEVGTRLAAISRALRMSVTVEELLPPALLAAAAVVLPLAPSSSAGTPRWISAPSPGAAGHALASSSTTSAGSSFDCSVLALPSPHHSPPRAAASPDATAAPAPAPSGGLRVVGRGTPHAVAIQTGLVDGSRAAAAPASRSSTGASSSVPPAPPLPPLAPPAPLADAASPPAAPGSSLPASSPTLAPAAPPRLLRRITAADARRAEEAAMELHSKMVSCFVREGAALLHDADLLAVMRSHLVAVEAAMPSHVRCVARAQAVAASPLLAHL